MLGARQRSHRRTSRPIRRRFRSTTSPRRSSSCEWLAADNFTLLGVARLRLTPTAEHALEPVIETGLGLLRSPRHAAVCAAAARRSRSRRSSASSSTSRRLLIVTKANVNVARAPPRLSRLHRRQALRRRRQARRRIPHRRAVHLDRLHALDRASFPICAARSTRAPPRRLRSRQPFRQGAGQCAGDLSARRAVPDRRGHALSISRWPSCSSTSARACACWRGATASTASSRSWSIVPRERYNSQVRAQIGDYLADGLQRPRHAPSIRTFRKGRWCACISSSAATTARRRSRSRRRSNAQVDAIVRTWTDGVRRSACRAHDAKARRARCWTRYRDAFPDGYREVYSPATAVADIRDDRGAVAGTPARRRLLSATGTRATAPG